jgi:hypothetical protein
VAGASVTTFDRFGDHRGYFNELYNEEKYDGLAAPAQNWKQASGAFPAEPFPSTLSPARAPASRHGARFHGFCRCTTQAVSDVNRWQTVAWWARAALRREGQTCPSSVVAGVLLLVSKARAARAALLSVRQVHHVRPRLLLRRHRRLPRGQPHVWSLVRGQAHGEQSEAGAPPRMRGALGCCSIGV